MTVLSHDAIGEAVVAAIAAAGAGATGVDLSFASAELALAHGCEAADRIAEAADLEVFIRSDVPLAAGGHTVIRTTPRRPGTRSVVDLEIDRLGRGPASEEVAAAWPADDGSSSLVSTLGFGDLADAELMALATVATVRRTAAITTDRPAIVRRVVHTVNAVLDAGRVA